MKPNQNTNDLLARAARLAADKLPLPHAIVEQLLDLCEEELIEAHSEQEMTDTDVVQFLVDAAIDAAVLRMLPVTDEQLQDLDELQEELDNGTPS
jgi:hypothetical protein